MTLTETHPYEVFRRRTDGTLDSCGHFSNMECAMRTAAEVKGFVVAPEAVIDYRACLEWLREEHCVRA